MKEAGLFWFTVLETPQPRLDISMVLEESVDGVLQAGVLIVKREAKKEQLGPVQAYTTNPLMRILSEGMSLSETSILQ